MEIRDERDADRDAVRLVDRHAFETDAEARLVDHLHADHAVCASIVAAGAERVVGHALFSHAHLDLGSSTVAVGALGPVAVLPEWQRRGVGTALIRAGLERCWALHLPAVIVLGHPQYYARFGFRRADTWQLRCEFDVPPEAFMVAWASNPTSGPGIAKYHAAFADV